MMRKVEEAFNIISRNAVEVISDVEMLDRLKKRRALRVKFGADPTAPDIHLGHTVILQKLRQFQDLGHQVYFIIGDFTARIGDPSGQSQTRKPLLKKEIIKNSKTYQDQIFKILDRKRTKVLYNSKWLDKLGVEGIIKLSSMYTVARMIERDDFNKRFRDGISITILEFLYPLIQAYDSVMVRADIELGGSDQKFNLLVGREIQREYNQEPQIVMTMPLLEGTDGVRKMSKSYKNYIGITESPKEIFGKIMSISDELMYRYYQLLTPVSPDELVKIRRMHPRDAKVDLAKRLVATYYGEKVSEEARVEFERVFANGEFPEKIQEVSYPYGKVWIVDLLVNLDLASSKNEAKRMILQGSVKVDRNRITDTNTDLDIKAAMIIQVGKRAFRKVKPIKKR